MTKLWVLWSVFQELDRGPQRRKTSNHPKKSPSSLLVSCYKQVRDITDFSSRKVIKSVDEYLLNQISFLCNSFLVTIHAIYKHEKP